MLRESWVAFQQVAPFPLEFTPKHLWQVLDGSTGVTQVQVTPPQVQEGCKQSSECPLSFPESTSWLLNPMWTLLAASWSSRHATMQSFCGRYAI